MLQPATQFAILIRLEHPGAGLEIVIGGMKGSFVGRASGRRWIVTSEPGALLRISTACRENVCYRFRTLTACGPFSP